jgi:peroxiredoxin
MNTPDSHPSGATLPAKMQAGSALKTVAFICLATSIAGTFCALLYAFTQQKSGTPAGSPPPSASPLWFAKLPSDTLSPDFALPSLDDGKEVRLSNFRGHKPLVLIFGSLSCDRLCTQVEELDRLQRVYGGRAAFLFVYLREAHGLPRAWRSRTPREYARHLVAEQKLTIPCLFDEGGAVAKAYDAWPKRLVVVGTDGRIALDGGHGIPDEWDLSEVEAWLQRHTN